MSQLKQTSNLQLKNLLFVIDFDTFYIFQRIIFTSFFNSGTRDFKVKVSADFERLALPYTKEKSFFGCNQDFEKLALRLMIQQNLYHPKTVKECRDLYDKLIQYISVL